MNRAQKECPDCVLPLFKFISISAPKENLEKIELINALSQSRQELIRVSTMALGRSQFCKENSINELVLEKVIESIAYGYHTVSYHNFSHGFTLMQVRIYLA